MKAFLLAFKATIIGIAVFAKTFRYRANFSRGVVLFVFLLLSFSTFSQTPTSFQYQAVLRDASGGVLANQQVEIGVALLQGSVTGTEIFTETHSVTTNNFGLANLQIGSVNTTGMQNIDWSSGSYFIQISVDGVIMGTSQLLSVPYALHAKVAETVTGGITETDPVYSGSEAANISATDITNLGNLSGVNTGDQDLSTLATKTALGDSTAQVRSEIPDVSGFLTAETDPTFTSSQAANIDATDITNLGNLSGVNTGDQDLSTLATKTALGDSTAQVRSEIPDVSGFLTAETDPTFTSSQAANIDATDITNLGNLSGVNTGDQDLSTLATKTALGDSTAQVRSEIPDVSGFLTAETDPTFTSSQAANIDATDITNLGNLSGVNTGDQDLSTLATKTALGDSTAQVRSEIPDVSGFLTSESDPTFTSSQAANIDATDITNLGNLSGTNTGDQDISGITTNATAITAIETEQTTQNDAIALNTAKTGITSAQANAIVANTGKDTTGIYHSNRTALDAVTGTNTGDQNLSSLATKTALGDSTAQVRSEIPDVSGFISAEEDPIYATDSTFLKSGVTAWDTSVAKTITAADTANWNNKVDTLIAGTGITISGDTIKATGSNSSTTYSVGDFAQGGVVFYVDETGQHGLVCAKTDQDGGSGISWYAGTYGNTQAKGDGPFAGEANTSIIIAAQVAIGDDGSTYAARICNELQITEGGKTYGDWYLPSKEELKLMYRNKAVIDATAGANGGSGFASHYYYWSSTEFDDYAAWELSFNVGYPSTSYKVTPERVRAVRAF